MAKTETGDGARLRKFSPNAALKNFREAAHMTQARLAELAGMSQAAIARLESGETRTNADYAMRLAPLLGREPRDLFPPATDRVGAEGEIDDAVMRRAIAVGRRFAVDDDQLLVDLTGLVYGLLIREQRGHPISDDENTLSLIESFVRRLRERIRR